MIQRRSEKPRGPRPELLAAYVDGELDAPVRRQVEAWLTEHPEAAAEVEAQRRLAQSWQAGSPPEPTQAEWAAVLDRIEAALPSAAVEPKETGSPWGLGIRPWLTRAAALLIAVLLGGAGVAALVLALLPGRPVSPDDLAAREPAEPYPVVLAGEVEIVSMHGADAAALVVGEPPAKGPYALLARGEVTLLAIEPDEDDMVPLVTMNESTTAPMIVAPLAWGK
jgi:anti-sigma factor RsiW